MKLNSFNTIFIISLSLFGIIYTWEFKHYKCMDDSLESKNICGFERNNTVYIAKTCRGNQLCSKLESDSSSLYKCQKMNKKKHQGSKCIANGDCLSGKCDKKCKTNTNSCTNNYGCDKNKGYCNGGKCIEFVKAKKECTEKDVCEAKHGCNIEDGNTEGVCTQYGSLDDGEKAGKGIFCKSGIEYDGICVSVEEDKECNITTNKCQPKISNGEEEFYVNNEGGIDCEVYKKNYICPVSKLKQSFFKDYIKKYNKMKTDKILKKKKFRLSNENGFYFYNKKLMKKYFKYRYFEELRKIGVMNEEGKIEKDCEFDYYIKEFANTNSASYIKSIIFAIFGMILVLL